MYRPIFRPLVRGNDRGGFGRGLPSSLVSLITTSTGQLHNVVGPDVEYSYVDYLYGDNGEVVYGDPDGVELWDDDLATSANGWSYLGSGVWECDGSSGDVWITNLLENGSAARFDIEIIEYTSGKLYPKIEGTLSYPPLEQVGRVIVDVRDTLGYEHTGMASLAFVGKAKIHSIQKLEIAPAILSGELTYKNELPEGAEDFTDTLIWNQFDVDSIVDDLITFADVNDARLVHFDADYTIGEEVTFSVELMGTPGETINIEVDTEETEVTLTNNYTVFSVTTTLTTTTPSIRIIRRGVSDALSVYARNPMVEKSSGVRPYIPPGTSGTITYNKGLDVGPAFTQMLQNSGFVGGVDEDTVPTGWGDYHIGNFTVFYSDETMVVDSEDASSRYFIGQTMAVSANTKYTATLKADVIEVLADIQKLFTFSLLPSGATLDFYIDGESVPNISSTPLGVHDFKVILNVGSTAGTVEFRMGVGANGTSAGKATLWQPQITEGPYEHPYIKSPEDSTATQVSRAGTTGNNGVWTTMSGERGDGVELWVKPNTVYIDENNFSTYDPSTGECRIVSDGAWVNLAIPNVLEDGGEYRVNYQEINRVSGFIKAVYTDPDFTLDNGSEILDTVSVEHTLSFGRSGACDVTFKLSVQKLEPYITELKEAYQGKPDGVELVVDGDMEYATTADWGEASPTNTTLRVKSTFDPHSGGQCLHAAGPTGSGVQNISADLEAGERYLVSGWVKVVTGEIQLDVYDSQLGPSPIGESSAQGWTYLHDIRTALVTTTGGVINAKALVDDTEFYLDDVSIQKLQPAKMTLALLVTMGIGSDEISGTGSNVNLNVVDVNGTVDGVLWYQGRNDGLLTGIVRSNDGTSSAEIYYALWDRGEKHLKVVETDEAGAQYRVKNLRLTPDLIPIGDWQYSSWSTFDDSFDPEEAERLALNGTTPGQIIFKATFNEGEVDEATLLKLVNRYGR